MATKCEELQKLHEGKGCLANAAFEEPIFILRAQDALAADLVEKWAIWARAGGTSPDKVNEAMNLAEEMRRWQNRKHPD